MGHTPTIINGKEAPSVTQITGILNKPKLNKWVAYVGTKEADRISGEAAERGRTLHSYIERFMKGETLVFCGEDQELRPIFRAWFDWWRESKFQCYAQEIKVISKKYNYGGTFDAIIFNEKGRILVDWKFSNTNDHFRWLQLAGYAQAYFEETGTKIKKGKIVRIDRKAKVHVSEAKNLWKYVPLFIACRKLYDFVNKKGKFSK